MCRVPSLHCRADCSGAWGGSKALDQCKVCGGRNACADCKGWPNGGNLTDNCGKCDDSPKNDCKPDCAAVWGGSKQARPALPRSWVVFKLPPRLESYILHVKPSARTHTAAPHCDSHCQQLRVVLTLQFLWRQAAAGGGGPRARAAAGARGAAACATETGVLNRRGAAGSGSHSGMPPCEFALTV